MTDQEFKEASEKINKLTGIFFPDSKKYFVESRLEKRVADLKGENDISTVANYLDFLASSRGRGELNHFYNLVTINETFFFRSPPQFNTLEQFIIPELLNEKGKFLNSIRFWSAASSSGEEIYSLAMLIKEKFVPNNKGFNFLLEGTDLNADVLEKAKNGIYKQYAVRNIPEPYMQKYFKHPNSNEWHLSEEIKKMVSFRQANLNNPMDLIPYRKSDVVFLANVLIYFNQETKEKLLKTIYDLMSPGGYLFIGYSETLQGIKHQFETVHFPKTIVYKKNQ